MQGVEGRRSFLLLQSAGATRASRRLTEDVLTTFDRHSVVPAPSVDAQLSLFSLPRASTCPVVRSERYPNVRCLVTCYMWFVSSVDH